MSHSRGLGYFGKSGKSEEQKLEKQREEEARRHYKNFENSVKISGDTYKVVIPQGITDKQDINKIVAACLTNVRNKIDLEKPNPKITKLDLSYIDLRENIENLANFLKADTVIKELRLVSCNLGSDDFIKILKALESNKSLNELQVGINKIGKSAIAPLSEFIRKNRTLKFLYIGSNELRIPNISQLIEAVKENRTILGLTALGNEMKEEQLAEIMHLTTRNKIVALGEDFIKKQWLFKRALFSPFVKKDEDYERFSLAVKQILPVLWTFYAAEEFKFMSEYIYSKNGPYKRFTDLFATPVAEIGVEKKSHFPIPVRRYAIGASGKNLIRSPDIVGSGHNSPTGEGANLYRMPSSPPNSGSGRNSPQKERNPSPKASSPSFEEGRNITPTTPPRPITPPRSVTPSRMGTPPRPGAPSPSFTEMARRSPERRVGIRLAGVRERQGEREGSGRK
jgi:hypothetical protein